MVITQVVGAGLRLLAGYLKKELPIIMKSQNTPEGRRKLIERLKKDAIEYAGVKGGTFLINEVKNNMKITYENGRVCVKYRKFKKCMKHKTE